MITLVTGDKNVGKTSYMEAWYREDPVGVGVLSRKVYRGELFEGYDFVFLPGWNTRPSIRFREEDLPEGAKIVRRGRFCFSLNAFEEANRWVESHAVMGEPVWIDEIGGVELSGKGFDPLLVTLLSKNQEIRAVCRLHLMEELICRYGLTDRMFRTKRLFHRYV